VVSPEIPQIVENDRESRRRRSKLWSSSKKKTA
jgi:hypothetical protein